jgi:hypothetical protein
MTRNSRRLPVVVVLVGLLVAAVALGDRQAPSSAGVAESVVAASMPAPGIRSSAWFCSGGPVTTGPSPDRITISNVGSRPVTAAVDVMVAARPVSERLVTVAARTSTTLAVAQLSPAPAAAVVVQPLGPGIVVQQGYATASDVAMAPCATRAAANWYFAAGASVGGGEQWLSIFDPFAIDAVVDIEAYTESGFRAPGALQGLVVPAGSRISVRLDRAVAEQRHVAIGVHVRNNALVVTTEAIRRPSPGSRTGVSLSLGAISPARVWMFADDRSRVGELQELVLANPGDVDATVRVSVAPDVASVIDPRVVRVPATSAVTVDFSGVVPAGVAYTLVARSTVPVVAETRSAFATGYPGLASEVGAPETARSWAFAGGPFSATGVGGARPRLTSGFDINVVMAVGATAQEINAVHYAIVQNGHIARFHTVNRVEALGRFRAANHDNPALIASTTPAMMPVSFDVGATGSSWIAPLAQYLGGRPGVATVVTAATQRPLVADELVVLNPGRAAVHVSVVASAAGSVLSGPGMRDVPVVPGGQVTISLVGLTRTGAAAVLSATGPVVAERFVAGPWGVTRSAGVPGR